MTTKVVLILLFLKKEYLHKSHKCLKKQSPFKIFNNHKESSFEKGHNSNGNWVTMGKKRAPAKFFSVQHCLGDNISSGEEFWFFPVENFLFQVSHDMLWRKGVRETGIGRRRQDKGREGGEGGEAGDEWPWECQGTGFYRQQVVMLCSISLWIMFMIPTIFFLWILIFSIWN